MPSTQPTTSSSGSAAVKSDEFDNIFEQVEDWSADQWQDVCKWVADIGPVGAWISNNILRRLTIEAPVVLSFVTLCTVLFFCLPSSSGRWLGVHDTWNSSRIPWQYTSLLTHIAAHVDMGHLRGNMTHLLLTGPSVERAFGSKNVLYILLVVAITSAIMHIWVGGYYTHQLGASGVVFAFILLNSLVSASHGKIPVSFILTAIYYLGDELYDFFFDKGPTSHHAHLTGGLVGAAAGFYLHRQRSVESTRKYAMKWMKVNPGSAAAKARSVIAKKEK
jgi:membrane associated rhomboid family serine protease